MEGGEGVEVTGHDVHVGVGCNKGSKRGGGRKIADERKDEAARGGGELGLNSS